MKIAIKFRTTYNNKYSLSVNTSIIDFFRYDLITDIIIVIYSIINIGHIYILY